ncbi:TlpA disulfide reductase family protein [Chitinophagaceae bacterium 26-R-25]|nr:TlpA disulfide reductase family protein [Chitinophagaceae bacterium 26-R-25]
MSKLLSFFVGLLLSLCSMAQMAEIRGIVKPTRFADKEISLFTVHDGELEAIANAVLAEDGSFGFLFTPSQEGFYALGWKDVTRDCNPVYIKKGDKATVEIEGRVMTFIGKQTAENAVVSKWLGITDSIHHLALHSVESHEVFFPALTKVASQIAAFKKTINTPDTAFNALMKDVVTYDLDLCALTFLRVPRAGVFPTKEQQPPYYRTIVDQNKFNNNHVLKMITGGRYIRLYADYAISGRVTLDESVAVFNDNDVKGAYILSDARVQRSMKTYAEFVAFMDKYGQYFQSPYHQSVTNKLGIKIYSADKSPLKPAFSFTYPDQTGKMVSLKDFRGKVVLLDMWATWCGPCLMEIPSLKRLEKELEGENIAFVGVSMDEFSDKQKWLDKIKEKGLEGVQLIAGGMKSKIAADYSVEAIPRFMVFDKNGNVVTTDAPRPSRADALKTLLLDELKK